MQIRDLERKTGLERATIRFYEREGFLKPTRQENGYRDYSQEDCETLCKIKFLRQLGMPLEQVRSLQQGSTSFSDALAEQIRQLSSQIQSATRAREVCQEMQAAGVQYETLDVNYYMSRLNRPYATGPSWQPKPVPELNLKRQQPRYPRRRFFARMIDISLVSLVLNLLVYVLFRVRPSVSGWDSFLEILLQYGGYFLSIPVVAAMVHFWGTTPGKWAFGIRLEYINGGKLPMDLALEREWDVLRYGMGWGLPVWTYWRQYKSRKEYLEEGESLWDEHTEIICEEDFEGKQLIAMGVLAAICIHTPFWIATERMLPKYRGDVTVAQYAENYNYLMSQLGYDDSWGKMQSDGGFDDGAIVIYINGTPTTEPDRCSYEMDADGSVAKISYDQSWTDILYLTPALEKSKQYAYTALATQEDTSFVDLLKFSNLMEQAGTEENGTFTYKDIEISWSMEGENYVLGDTWCTPEDYDQPSKVNMQFEITIHK